MDINYLQALSRIMNLGTAPQVGNEPSGGVDTTGNAQLPVTIPNANIASGTGALEALQNYKPDTTISDQYRQALSQMPQREPVSRANQILASIGGLGGGSSPSTYSHGAALGFNFDPLKAQNITDQMANQPYYQKLNDWSNRTNVLAKGATEEDKSNVNKRIALTQAAAQDLKDRQLAEKTVIDREKVEISKKRAEAYIFDKEHPDWKPYAQPGGNLFYINPKDPKDVFDTGLTSGKLTDEDKINLRTTGRLSEITARGEESRKTEGVKEENRQSDIAARGEQQRTTNAAKPASSAAGKPVSASQEKVAQYNRAKQASLVDHPEWAPYIILDKGGANSWSISDKTPPDMSAAIGRYITGGAPRTGDIELAPSGASNPPAKGVGDYGNIPPSQSNKTAATANAGKMKRANDFLKSNNKAINDKNLQLLMSTPESEWK